MVRPIKEDSPMSEIVTVRCSKPMKDRIRTASEVSGLTIGEIVRRRLLGTKIPHDSFYYLAVEVYKLRKELARQGGLIKHMYGENPFDPVKTGKMLDMQTETLKSICELSIAIKAKTEGGPDDGDTSHTSQEEGWRQQLQDPC